MSKVFVISNKKNIGHNIEKVLDKNYTGYDVIYVKQDELYFELIKTYKPESILLEFNNIKDSSYDIYNNLKNNINTKKIPIIALIEKGANKRIKAKALECGIDAFLFYSNEIIHNENLKQKNVFFNHFLASTKDAIFITNQSGQCIFCNNSAKKIFDFDNNEYTKQELYKYIVPEKNQSEYFDVINKLEKLDDKSSQTIELIICKKNEVKLYLELNLSFFEYNGSRHLFWLIRNTTETKTKEIELKAAKEKAEQSDKLKKAFLANISHEIRTPMNAIVGFSQLLSTTNDAQKINTYTNYINKSSLSLLKLIEDIVSISQIESENVKLRINEYNINDILDLMFEDFNRKISSEQKKYLKLFLKKERENQKLIIKTDKVRFEQILSNLLNNAIKFTENGFIEFGYNIENKKIIFYVRDTGLGINKDKLGVIFNRFEKIEVSKTKLYGGTGLGLAISKNLVDMLGGEIWVESEVGSGSVFYFSLPTKPFDDKNNAVDFTNQKNLQYDFNGKTILVAEDAEYNYLLLEEITELANVKIIWAKNGVEAVDKIKNCPDIDLVLMDMKMPKMNGYEATMKIKEIKPNIPIIGQSAYVMTVERKKAIKAGCDDYLSKPIILETLLQTLYKYLNH